MAFNGSGTYNLPAGNPVVTGTTISSSTTNTTNSDIATALTNCITRDGQSTPSANLPMNAKKLTGLAAGTSAGDSVRYEQVVLTSALGTNVATFLATPSSANLAAALTDETGSGAAVFATSPTLVTPVLGTPSSGNLSSCTNAVGYGLKSATTTVSVSAATAPTTGQALIATSSTAATWQTLGGSSALVLIATVTASAAATVNFRNSFSSTYDTYLILCNNLSMSTSASLGMQFAIAGTADSSTVYGWQRLETNNSTFTSLGVSGQPSFQTGQFLTTTTNSTIAVTVSGVNSTLRGKGCTSNYGGVGTTGIGVFGQNVGTWGSASVASGIQFYHDGGATITGTFYLYGYAKS